MLHLAVKAALEGGPGELLLQHRGEVQVGRGVGLDLAQQAVPDAAHAARVAPRLGRAAPEVVDQPDDVLAVALHRAAQGLRELRHWRAEQGGSL